MIIFMILIFFFNYEKIILKYLGINEINFINFISTSILPEKVILTFLKYGVRNNFNINYIYDIFHNDNNKIIIIMPAEFFPPSIKYINSNSNSNAEFKLHICHHMHTFIYELFIETEYKKNIQLLINDKVNNIKVNKYPEYKDEIIMSTIVLNEDNYIRQWINFHINIGVKRFIIYDNSKINDSKSYKSVEKSSDLKNVLSDFIKKGVVLLIKWTYPYRLTISGISGQTTQQNHSIYAFKNSKYIGFFDIDEYINIQNNTNINSLFDSLIKSKKINTNKIGSFTLYNKFFCNPNNLSTKNYDFLKIFTCKKISKIFNPSKGFVLPKNVNSYSVHHITNGKEMYYTDPKDIYFNHYYFLNKATRGRDRSNLQDKTILKHCKFIKF